MRIIVIDDNTYTFDLVKTCAEDMGDFRVEYTPSLPKLYERGCWIFLELDFDCELTGTQALDFIRDNPHQNFVAVAGPGEEDLAERAIDLGARAFLFKPIRKNDLIRIITKILAG